MALSFQSAEEAKKNITDDAKEKIEDLYTNWSYELRDKANELKHSEKASDYIQSMNIRQLSRQMRRTGYQVSDEIEGIVKESMYMTSESVVDAYRSWLYDFGFSTGDIQGAFINVPDQIVRRLVTGQVYESGWSLSKSIWSDNQDTQRKAYEIVAEGLAKNSTAYDVSKALEKYVNPSRAKQWNPVLKMKNTQTGEWEYKRIYKKSVDYNAQRLVRTLSQHSYQQTLIETSKNNPFITGFKWIANGSRTCEICAERDGKIFDKDEVPMDHPNGMCVMEPIIDEDKMLNQLEDWIKSPDGTYPEIDNFANEFGYKAQKVTNLEDYIKKYGKSDVGPQSYVQNLNYMQKAELNVIMEGSEYNSKQFYIANIYDGDGSNLGKKMKEFWESIKEVENISEITEENKDTYRKLSMDDLKELSKANKYYQSGNWMDYMWDGGDIEGYEFIYGAKGYVGSVNSFVLNEFLREDFPGLTYEKAKEIGLAQYRTLKYLDDAISSYKLEENIILNRFVADDYLKDTFGGTSIEDIKSNIGSVFKNNQYMSTTIEINPFFSNRPALLRIEADKGTNAFFTQNYIEGEVILGRDTEYIIKEVIDHENNPLLMEMDDVSNEFKGIEIVISFINK